jgi:hypothetical protein
MWPVEIAFFNLWEMGTECEYTAIVCMNIEVILIFYPK